ncbi:MAG: cobaltochelatase CobN, partial [Mycobacterium sp.]|nr:cobaltochelatase CobN [Mycobacterium sp.]
MNTDDAPQRVHRIALLSTSDTDLLSARASLAAYKLGNPARQSIEAVLDGAEVVVLRVLGSSAEVADELSALRATGLPLVVLGGERMPSAELMEQSSVPIGLAAQAHSYLAEGGPANLAQLHAFLCDTVLLTGQGFDEPVVIPEWGYAERAVIGTADVDARIGVLYYRAHEVSGNSGFAHALADAIEAAGTAVGVPIFASSLRSAPDELFDALATLDAVVISMLAAGGSKSASAGAGEDDASWDIERIAAMNIPVLQGLCLTSSRAEWDSNDDGVTPLDSATQIAIPEFDGRIITAPYSFKEVDADGLPHYVADPERCARVAAIAVKHALLRRVPNEQKKLALVLSAYPSKHSRVGNAVGLDTPASAVRLLRRLAQDGYDVGDGFGVLGIEDETRAGDRLMHTLIDAGGQDEQWLTTEQVADAQVKVASAQYAKWTADLPAQLRDAMADAWGPAPGRLFVNDDGDLVLAALRSGNIVLMIQPPRGFGENPVAIYHDPDLPPSHHYLAAYRWLEHGFGAHAVVHLGKHGSMEWLPGKNAALSAACATDAVLGNL